MTNDELAAIEARATSTSMAVWLGVLTTDIPALIAEVRRLRSLFTEEDADLVDSFDAARPNSRTDARLQSLAARIRQAIGEPPAS